MAPTCPETLPLLSPLLLAFTSGSRLEAATSVCPRSSSIILDVDVVQAPKKSQSRPVGRATYLLSYPFVTDKAH